jgi:hypothetical protein
MITLKKIIELIFAFLISFGFYYLIGWFISNEHNLFIWSIFGKIVYLILSGLMTFRFLKEFGWEHKENNTQENEN